ncbi:hypothetical protein KSP39_PZI012172 [Platanthera zijinensis]|uniref:Uncharacterized protein n=1 Tax=Platanthera zijinensis TaxID=2320716 RepID=A0AAP0G4W2_9ASPA
MKYNKLAQTDYNKSSKPDIFLNLAEKQAAARTEEKQGKSSGFFSGGEEEGAAEVGGFFSGDIKEEEERRHRPSGGHQDRERGGIDRKDRSRCADGGLFFSGGDKVGSGLLLQRPAIRGGGRLIGVSDLVHGSGIGSISGVGEGRSTAAAGACFFLRRLRRSSGGGDSGGEREHKAAVPSS